MTENVRKPTGGFFPPYGFQSREDPEYIGMSLKLEVSWLLLLDAFSWLLVASQFAYSIS